MLLSGQPALMGVASGAMRVSPNFEGFTYPRKLLEGKSSSVWWLWGPPWGGILEKFSGDQCLKTQPIVMISAYGNGQSDLLTLPQASWLVEWRSGLNFRDRICFSVQGQLLKVRVAWGFHESFS